MSHLRDHLSEFCEILVVVGRRGRLAYTLVRSRFEEVEQGGSGELAKGVNTLSKKRLPTLSNRCMSLGDVVLDLGLILAVEFVQAR